MATATRSSSRSAADEAGYDSSCSSSSITALESRRSWISDVSSQFGSSSSISSTISSSSTSTRFSSGRKPHKANQAEWEAIRRLRCLTGGRVGLDHFRLVRRLGSGDLGNVYLCRLREPRLSGSLYAMKVVDTEALAIRKKLQRAEMEKEILAMLDHPFLPTLYAEFDAAHYSCLVMEYCPGGDLHVVRQRQPGRRFSISSTRFYAAEALVALEYLHMMGVVYRDLKPENVLMRADGHIMLSDFDLSLKCDVVPRLRMIRQKADHASGRRSPSCVPPPMQPVLSCLLGGGGKKIPGCRKTSTSTSTSPATTSRTTTTLSSNDDKKEGDGEEHEHEHEHELQEEVDDDQYYSKDPELVAEPISARSKSFVGTHEYLAPEVISGLGHGSAVDWWTLGIFLYELLYGKTPFKGDNNGKTLVNITKQPLRFPKTTTAQFTSTRDTDDIVRSAQDLITKLLVKNPKKRIGSLRGSVEIKRHDFFKDVNWALIRTVKPPELLLDKLHIPLPLKINNNVPQHFDFF